MAVHENTIILWYAIDDISHEVRCEIDKIPYDLELCTVEQNLFEIINSLINSNNNILFVICGYYSNIDDLLCSINTIKEIISIFIYDVSALYQPSSFKNYSKLYDIYLDYKILIKQLSKMARILTRQFVVFHYKENDLCDYMRDLSCQNGVNNYISDQICRHNDFGNYATINNNRKSTFLDYCRTIYISNIRQLKIIDNLEENYDSKNALMWYTSDTPLFKIINKELRTKSFPSSNRISDCFIADIYFQLKSEWKNSLKNNQMTIFHVYRGLTLSGNGIEWINNHVGCTISILGFLSTSKSQEAAMMFAENVLFDIEINSNCSHIIYADVSKMSRFEDEEEVLLDFNSIFKILSSNFDDEKKLWIVNLISTDINQEFLYNYQNVVFSTAHFSLGAEICYFNFSGRRIDAIEELANFNRIEVIQDTSFRKQINYCVTLQMVNNVEKALIHLNSLINTVENDVEKLTVYYHIGKVYLAEGDFSNSLVYLQMAHDISKTMYYPDAYIINNWKRLIDTGLVYACLENYDMAFDMFFKSLSYITFYSETTFTDRYYSVIKQLEKIFSSQGSIDNNKTHLSLAMAYWIARDRSTALIYFKSAKEIDANNDNSFLLFYHCFLGITTLLLSNMDGPNKLDDSIKQQSRERSLMEVKQHFRQTLRLARNIDNIHAINLMTSGLAYVYFIEGKLNLAIQLFKCRSNRLNIRDKTNTDFIIYAMRTLFSKTKQWNKAILYYRTMLSKFASYNNTEWCLSKIYYYLANIYLDINDSENALVYLENVVHLHSYVPKYYLRLTISAIRDIYIEKQQFDIAIKFFQELLKNDYIINNKILLAKIHEVLGQFYTFTFDYEGSLTYLKNSIFYLSNNTSDASLSSQDILKFIHHLYTKKRQFHDAIQFYHEVLSKYISNYDDFFKFDVLTYLADSYMQIDHRINALVYYKQLLQISIEKDYWRSIPEISKKIVGIYTKRKQLNRALQFYKEIWNKFEKESSGLSKAYVNDVLADVYSELNDYTNAIIHYHNALENLPIKYKELRAQYFEILRKLHKLYDNTQQFNQIIEFFSQMTLKFNETDEDIFLGDINRWLANAYVRLKNFQNALTYFHTSMLCYESGINKYSYIIMDGQIRTMYFEIFRHQGIIQMINPVVFKIDDCTVHDYIGDITNQMADIYINELNDFANASDYYRKSITSYLCGKNKHLSYQILEKAHDLYIKHRLFHEAVCSYHNILQLVELFIVDTKYSRDLCKMLDELYEKVDDSIYLHSFIDGKKKSLPLTKEHYIIKACENSLYNSNGSYLKRITSVLIAAYCSIGKWHHARKYSRMALKYNKNDFNYRDITEMHIQRGDIEFKMKHYTKAIDHYELALHMLAAISLDKIEICGILNEKIAYIYQIEGRTTAARRYRKNALIIYKMSEPIRSIMEYSQAMSTLNFCLTVEDFITIIYTAKRMLKFLGKVDQRNFLKHYLLLNNIGWSYCMNGNYKKSLKFCINSLQIFEKYTTENNNILQCYALHSIALIYSHINEFNQAMTYCSRLKYILDKNLNSALRNQISADWFELLGDIYVKENLQLIAVFFYKKSLDLLNIILPRQNRNIKRIQEAIKRINEVDF